MLTLAKYIWNQVQAPAPTLEEQYIKLIREHDIQWRQLGESSDEENDECDKSIEIEQNQIFTNKGVITHLFENNGRIDNVHFFKNSCVKSGTLKKGMEVQYLAGKCADNQIKIIEIEIVTTESWDGTDFEVSDLLTNRPELFTTRKLILNGTITNKDKDTMTIELENQDEITVQIDTVSTNFQPMKGDKIGAQVEVQTDITKPRFMGSIIRILNIMPLTNVRIEGVIQKLPDPSRPSTNYGFINDGYIFFSNAFDNADNLGKKPSVGDRVIAEAISHSQTVNYKTFEYRCIKIIPFTDDCVEVVNTPFNHNDDYLVDICVTSSSELKVHLRKDETKLVIIEIRNNSNNTRTLLNIEKIPDAACKILANLPLTLTLSEELKVEIEVTGNEFGLSRIPIEFKFNGDESQKVTRIIEVNVDTKLMIDSGNVDQFDSWKNRNFAYTKTIQRRNQYSNALPGERVKATPKFVDVKLKPYELPGRLMDIVFSSHSNIIIQETLKSILPRFDVLNERNYFECFHNLLYLDELHNIYSIRKYDRDRAFFTPQGEYLILEMSNILESRPSLTVGDSLIASQTKHSEELKFEGFIHKLERDRIFVKFHIEFHSKYRTSPEDYRIVFHAARSIYIKQHNALESILYSKCLKSKILFPDKIAEKPEDMKVQLHAQLSNDGCLQVNNGKFEFFNNRLNDIQKMAIVNVLQGVARPLPYIVFGPPGTGKTSTIIEMILQIFTRVRGSKLLIATPSNSAANLITQRLINSGVLSEGQFLRLIGYNALNCGKIPAEFIPYCALADITAVGTGLDQTPSYYENVPCYRSKEIQLYRIVIGTCHALGVLLQIKIPKNHFSHIIVDEAGQCTEPEIMIPLSRVAERNGQIILAGDPMQLGPVVLSDHAKDFGLDKSYLVRILEQPPYLRDPDRFDTGAYDGRLVTKLLHNYRALPTILSYYSRLFYDSELKATISEKNSKEIIMLHSLINAGILPRGTTNNQALFFHAIRGREEQIPSSPSWLNLAEAASVVLFVKRLLRIGLSANDIGIITPYQLQSKQIRAQMEELLQLDDFPKVGSVEEFQGQERMVILISTVRSILRGDEADLRCKMGFVKNERRLNVAISRARAVVVCFGNPDLLEADSNWKLLIDECKANETFIGSKF